MKLQKLNCTCSAIHLYNIRSSGSREILSRSNFLKFLKDNLDSEIYDKEQLNILYICSDKHVKKQLKLIGFYRSGSYKGYGNNTVDIMCFHVKDNNRNYKSLKQVIKEMVAEW